MNMLVLFLEYSNPQPLLSLDERTCIFEYIFNVGCHCIIFFRYLMGLKHEYVIIDLINGMQFRGTLVNIDANMNTRLRNVKVIPVEKPPFHLDAFTLHGKTIASYILEDDTKIDCLSKLSYPVYPSATTSGVTRRRGRGRGIRRARFRGRGSTVCANRSLLYRRFSSRRGRPPSRGISTGCGNNLKGSGTGPKRGRPGGSRVRGRWYSEGESSSTEGESGLQTTVSGSETDEYSSIIGECGSKMSESDLVESERFSTEDEWVLMKGESSSLKGDGDIMESGSSLTNSSQEDFNLKGGGSKMTTGGRGNGSKKAEGKSRPTGSEIGSVEEEGTGTKEFPSPKEYSVFLGFPSCQD